MKYDGGERNSDGSAGLNGERAKKVADRLVEGFSFCHIDVEDPQHIRPQLGL
jgi:hypothetical protein